MNADKLDLIVGLLGWAIIFAISPILGAALALAGFAFITLWQRPRKMEACHVCGTCNEAITNRKEMWQHCTSCSKPEVMEMFWNEHP